MITKAKRQNIQKFNEKKLLAIDTSSATASVALIEFYDQLVCSSDSEGSEERYIPSTKILAECSIAQSAKTYSETLMPMVDHIFNLNDLAMQDIDYIACTNGPGSFTGLRIGAATAKGLAFAAGIPLIPVPTLDAMAYTVACIVAHNTLVVPIMDARRDQAYSAFYHDGCERKSDYMALPVDELLEKLRMLVLELKSERPLHILFITDGANDFGFNIAMRMGYPFSSEALGFSVSISGVPCSPLATYAGMLAGSPALAGNLPKGEFELMYIRKPQAEREREERESRGEI